MTAEKDGVVNTMTVAWATFGIMWQRSCLMVAIRPERYTNEIALKTETFSLTTLPSDPTWKKVLGFYGTKSGRDVDKIKECNLTVAHESETPFIEEGRLAIICKKLCVPQLSEADFPTDELNKFYGGTNNESGEGGGYHYLHCRDC